MSVRVNRGKTTLLGVGAPCAGGCGRLVTRFDPLYVSVRHRHACGTSFFYYHVDCFLPGRN